MEIRILTGERDCGKTGWCRTRFGQDNTGQVAGILQHKVFAGAECIGYDTQCIATGVRFPFMRIKKHTPADWEAGQSTGKFAISGSTLRHINALLMREWARQTKLFVIDEIGKLELHGRGLAPALETMLATKAGRTGVLLIVVRKSLVESVCERFKIDRYELICIN